MVGSSLLKFVVAAGLFVDLAYSHRLSAVGQDSINEDFGNVEAPGIVQFIPMDNGGLQFDESWRRDDYLREILTSDLTIAELELAGGQELEYRRIAQNWKDAFKVFLKQFDINLNEANRVYAEQSRSWIEEINKILLPHQKEILTLTIRRFLLRSVGLSKLINRPSFRQQQDISTQEYRAVIEAGHDLSTYLMEESNKIREQALNKCTSALPTDVQEVVQKASIKDQTVYQSLELLDWQLSLAFDPSTSAKFFENERNSVDQLLVFPQFNSEIDGSLALQINDHRQVGKSRVRVLVGILTGPPISTDLDFELSDGDLFIARNIVADLTELERDWIHNGVNSLERTRLANEEAAKRLEQFENRVMTPERKAKLALAIQAITIRRLGIFWALTNDELGSKFLLTDPQKNQLETAVKEAQLELRASSRKLEQEIYEKQIALLTEPNRAKIRKFFGPELKHCRANISLQLHNIQNPN